MARDKLTDIHLLMVEWGNWKSCRPAWERESGEPSGQKLGDSPFCSKPPPNVWMTPTYKITQFQDISEAYDNLPSFSRIVIRHWYIDLLKPADISRATGVHVSRVTSWRNKGLYGIARRLEDYA